MILMDLVRSYFNFLVDLTGYEDIDVLDILFKKEFRYDNEMDENCMYNGLMMRRIFSDEMELRWINTRNELRKELGRTANVLEMMVGLAWGCDHNIMYNPDYGDRIDVWFRAMINSLGLDDAPIEQVDDILERWLNKEYERNGDGGLFKLEHPRRRDLRNYPIWTQMNWWLVENYSEEFHL